jgi:hypothetical protein
MSWTEVLSRKRMQARPRISATYFGWRGTSGRVRMCSSTASTVALVRGHVTCGPRYSFSTVRPLPQSEGSTLTPAADAMEVAEFPL